MSLRQYQRKRNFKKTPEPKGRKSQKEHHLFVIQKHAASHLHYDFRIEMDGVLKSWAIPKGPSLDPTIKRLAVHVEDHPVAYGKFEGLIPQGEYGGGTVMLWDTGTWTSLDEDSLRAYKKGHLRLMLNAKKLKGRWDLIRLKTKQWLLKKYKDDYAKDQKDFDVTKKRDKSVATKRSLEEIRTHTNQVWTSKQPLKTRTPNRASHKSEKIQLIKQGKRRHHPDQEINKKRMMTDEKGIFECVKQAKFLPFLTPKLTTLVLKPPTGKEWLHEIKFDGYRILAYKKGKSVILKTRNNNDWTRKFKPISEAIQTLPVENLILDGEVVVLDKDGKSNFQCLQNAMKSKEKTDFVYYLFDLIYYDKYDLRTLALLERKRILTDILKPHMTLLQYSDHVVSDGDKIFHEACRLSLEGIVSKRIDSTYDSKRNQTWVKVKCIKRQEFVIGGYSLPKGKRAYFGALLLGVFNADKTLDYSGKVGTGFTQQTLKELHGLLAKNRTKTNPFNDCPPGYKNAFWVKPLFVCEVEFTEWTDKGYLRHPRFKGLRTDKPAKVVIREVERPPPDKKNDKSALKSKNFTLTHPEKVFYPEDKITKEDLLHYYEEVADYLLPHLVLRPLTLLRCPSGIEGQKCFYQRHYNASTPETLYPITFDKQKEAYLYLKDKEGLLSLVQMNVLEIHPWGSCVSHLGKPDRVIFDLDPAPGIAWAEVVAAAQEIKSYLEAYDLISFVKSTGGKGLHIVVPIKPTHRWATVKSFAHHFVESLEKLRPNIYISKMSKAKRSGKIFVDYLRNQATATAISAYSTRARLHAPVATPLFWEELSRSREDNSFTIKTLPKRLAALKTDPWENFFQIIQVLRLKRS